MSISLLLCIYQKHVAYSMVIWDTTSKLVKPSLAKFSLYWPILMASNHSSTVLKEEKSGVLRSRRGKWTLVDRKTREEHNSLWGSWFLRGVGHTQCEVMVVLSVIPWWQRCHGLEAVGVADHLVQSADNLAEFWPVVAVFLPAVQHQLMQGTRTVHRGWQPVVLLYGIDNLQEFIQYKEHD